jgi:hypothetical protein
VVPRALPAIAALVVGLEGVSDERWLHLSAAVALVAYGVLRFARPRWHPRWSTLRVSGHGLALWSFLMSSAHGAGPMVTPVLLASRGRSAPSTSCRRPSVWAYERRLDAAGSGWAKKASTASPHLSSKRAQPPHGRRAAVIAGNASSPPPPAAADAHGYRHEDRRCRGE